VGSVPLGYSPREIAFSPDGSRAYVSRTIGFSVIDTATETEIVAPVIGQDNFGVDVHPDGSRLYMASRDCDCVYVIDTATDMMITSIPVGVDPISNGRFIGPAAVCGDGTRTFPEECDDGNTEGGDCCSAGCTLEAAGDPCASDADACTDDECDGAGTCVHPAIVCDDGDLCTADSCNSLTGCVFAPPPAMAAAKLTISKLTTPPGDDGLNLRGTVTLVHPFNPPLDPVTNGAGVEITDVLDQSVLDVTLAGGIYDTVTRIGWKVAGSGRKWTYVNKSTTPPGGIVKLSVQDKSTSTPGLLKLTVKGQHGTYPVTLANLPLSARVILAPPMAATPQCGVVTFAGPPPAPSCTVNTSGSTVKCK
jgi:YVTN family beta-propeller protein/cysteine-rich repeat protein